MSASKKKIEVVTVSITSDENYQFEELLLHKDLEDQEFQISGKSVSLRILNRGSDTVIGLVVTTRNDNIPPKRNRRRKTISKLGLEDGEGLAYANVFLFEKKRAILMYEVNKFGCYIDHFISYIHRCIKSSDSLKPVNVVLHPILNKDEYKRMTKMTFHKSIELQVTNPKAIIEGYRHQNDALWNLCESAAYVGSTTVNAKFEVSARSKSGGLASKSLKSVIDSVLELARGPKGDNVKKVVVMGYEADGDDHKLHPIDLIADRFLRFIELDEPRENNDLLELQRSKEIKKLYSNALDDLNEILGNG